MSLALLKATLKNNWILFLIFLGILTMYMTIMISMYDPEQMELLTSMINLFPEDLMKAMGFSNRVTDLTSYLASWLYGLLMLAFPMVYSIILANRLVVKMVDNGSFSYLLSTPNSRLKIIFTQGFFAFFSMVILFAALFILGVLVSRSLVPGALDVNAFFRLNFTTLLAGLVVMMINFFFSCLFNESRISLGFGSGIPILFLLLKMLGEASKEAEVLKRFSLFGYYDPVELVKGSEIWGVNTAFIVLIILLFTGGMIVFNRKRLPL